MSKLIEKLSGSDAAKKALAKMIEAGAESVKDLSPEDIGGIGKTMDILMGHGFTRGMVFGAICEFAIMVGSEKIVRAILKRKAEKPKENEGEEEGAE